MRRTYTVLFALILTLTTGCKKKEGCKDIDAVNYDMMAEEDCECCVYEDVVFYAKDYIYTVSGFPYSILSNPIKVYVNGQAVGTVTAVYPNGPGTSTVPGIAIFEPGNTKKFEWYAEVSLPNGSSVVIKSGTLNASKNYMEVAVF